MLLHTDGLVLSEQTVGESDRLITVLTRSDGLIRAFARGAHQFKNKSAAATQLLTYSDFAIYRGREANSIDSADARKVFFGLRSDLEKLSLAQYFCELARTLAPEADSGEPYLRLMLNALHFLENGERPPLLLKAAVEMRMLTLAGYMPDLVACRVCGHGESDPMFLSVRGGTLLCAQCCGGRPPERDMRALTPGVLAAMRHTIYAPFAKLFSFELSPDGVRALAAAAESYLLATLERSFRALEFYHRVAENA